MDSGFRRNDDKKRGGRRRKGDRPFSGVREKMEKWIPAFAGMTIRKEAGGAPNAIVLRDDAKEAEGA
jgi:hypothetical protein